VRSDPKVFEPLADVLVRFTLSPDYPQWARSAALTFQWIYQQPVRHEYHLIASPTLLIVGADDHVVPLGRYATPNEAARLGDFKALCEQAASDIPRATRVVVPEQFLGAFLPFLAT
jgi:pimeloyl-ACP methyl ester carboxylesterase